MGCSKSRFKSSRRMENLFKTCAGFHHDANFYLVPQRIIQTPTRLVLDRGVINRWPPFGRWNLVWRQINSTESEFELILSLRVHKIPFRRQHWWWWLLFMTMTRTVMMVCLCDVCQRITPISIKTISCISTAPQTRVRERVGAFVVAQSFCVNSVRIGEHYQLLLKRKSCKKNEAKRVATGNDGITEITNRVSCVITWSLVE